VGGFSWARSALQRVPADQSLDQCNECGDGEDKCPVHLPIRARLDQLRGLLAE
jgi:predicted aldo/keto reductase-like oxidoreductase